MYQTLLAKLGKALDSAHIPYMVIGGQAVLLHGEPYLTRWLASFRDVVHRDLVAEFRTLRHRRD